MAKTTLNIKPDGTATVEGDKNTFVAKLLAGKKVKINHPLLKREVTVKS